MSVPGPVLTDRDRRLFAYFAVARHLTAEQVHLLLGGDHAYKQTYRRLGRLSTPGPTDPGTAYLARQDIRSRRGPAFGIWNLTARGWAEAEKSLFYPVSRPSPDVGQQFLIHETLLNQVFVELAVQLGGTDVPSLATLPFRWIPEAPDQLNFKMKGRHGLYSRTAVKPDAIIEVPSARRRFFLEAETGSQSITDRHQHAQQRAGSIKQKLLRYSRYFTGLETEALKATWYKHAFEDDLFPELVFLVHSPERKERVAWIVSRRFAKLPEPRPFAVRVLCFDEAAAAIGAITAKKLIPRQRLVTVAEASALAIRDRVNDLVLSFNRVLERVNAHNRHPKAERIALPAPPSEAVQQLKALIRSELLARPFNAPRWREHLIEETTEGSR